MRKLMLIMLLFLGLVGFQPAQAQYNLDIGASIGAGNYFGEIGGGAGEGRPFILDMKVGQSRLAAGGFVRYRFAKDFAARISANYVRVAGADSLSENIQRRGRNLSFRTEIYEAYLSVEYYFFALNDVRRTGRNKSDFKAYATIGIGGLLYYPHARIQDTWYSLRPLMTEGTENAYDEFSIMVPFGVGGFMTFNRKYRLGFEAVYRFAFTDYLDDISTDYAYDTELPFVESQFFANRTDERFLLEGEENFPHRGFYNPGSIRGNPDNDDGYLVVQLSFAYVIKGKSGFSRSKYNSVINRRRRRTKF